MLNLGLAIDRIKNQSSDVKYPKVNIEYKNSTSLSQWVLDNDSKLDSEVVFGKIFYNLGFDETDTINIGKIQYVDGYGIKFLYGVGTEFYDENNFVYLLEDEDNESCLGSRIVVGNGNTKVWCDCFLYTDGDMLFYILDYEEDRVYDSGCDKNIYFRSMNKDSITLSYEDIGHDDLNVYKIELYVQPSFSDRDNLFDAGYYELENEVELKKYIQSLKFPVSIVDVYKKICEISFNDIEKYYNVILKISICDGIMRHEFERVTDMVDVSHGRMERFTITKNNKTVSIGSGRSFGYIDVSPTSDFSIISEDTVKVSVDADSEIDMFERIRNLHLSDIDTAKEEVTKVRRLARELFKR